MEFFVVVCIHIILNIVTHNHTGYYDALRRRLFSHSLPYDHIIQYIKLYEPLRDICCHHHRLRCIILNYIPVSFDAMRSMCFLSNEFGSLQCGSVCVCFFFGRLFIPCCLLCRESRSMFAIFSHTHNM